MNVLFVRNYPLIDGTFTLLLRLAKKLKEDGHASYFLFFQEGADKNLLAEISKYSTILYYSGLRELKSDARLPRIDAIHGIVTGEALYRTYDSLKREYFPGAKVIIGVYHPRAYFSETVLGLTPDTHINKIFFKKLPPQNVLFMNGTVKRGHDTFFGLSPVQSPIIPLPVEVPVSLPVRSTVNRNKIVSVGRLVEFKNYIIPVIQAMADLNRKGYYFEYHIYGDGPMRKSIEAYIKKYGSESFVHLHGYLPYTDFRNAIADALLFIGMGTSIIESSSYGVPSLLAVESRSEFTYGWFYDNEGYEVGEQVMGQKEYDYAEFMLEAFNAGADTYKKMCEKSWNKARLFSMEEVVKRYYDFINNADATFTFSVPLWKRYWLKIIRQPFKLKLLIKKGYKHK